MLDFVVGFSPSLACRRSLVHSVWRQASYTINICYFRWRQLTGFIRHGQSTWYENQTKMIPPVIHNCNGLLILSILLFYIRSLCCRVSYLNAYLILQLFLRNFKLGRFTWIWGFALYPIVLLWLPLNHHKVVSVPSI